MGHKFPAYSQQGILHGAHVTEQQQLGIVDATIAHQLLKPVLQYRELSIHLDELRQLGLSVFGTDSPLKVLNLTSNGGASLRESLQFFFALGAGPQEREVAQHASSDVDSILKIVEARDFRIVVVNYLMD